MNFVFTHLEYITIIFVLFSNIIIDLAQFIQISVNNLLLLEAFLNLEFPLEPRSEEDKL
jgi:hypothetical protein